MLICVIEIFIINIGSLLLLLIRKLVGCFGWLLKLVWLVGWLVGLIACFPLFVQLIVLLGWLIWVVGVSWLVGGSLIDCLVSLVDWLCVFLFVWLFHLVG